MRTRCFLLATPRRKPLSLARLTKGGLEVDAGRLCQRRTELIA
jgi:hypothetical protein